MTLLRHLKWAIFRLGLVCSIYVSYVECERIFRIFRLAGVRTHLSWALAALFQRDLSVCGCNSPVSSVVMSLWWPFIWAGLFAWLNWDLSRLFCGYIMQYWCNISVLNTICCGRAMRGRHFFLRFWWSNTRRKWLKGIHRSMFRQLYKFNHYHSVLYWLMDSLLNVVSFLITRLIHGNCVRDKKKYN